MKLNNQNLLRTDGYINGAWTAAKNGRTFEIRNPFDQTLIAELPDMGGTETQAAINAAENALPAWRTRTAQERSSILRRWFELIHENLEDLATLLTLEQGKPITEARAEIRYGASFVEWFAEEAKRIYGDVIAAEHADRRILVLKQPVGVVAAITPWNFPNAMITRKVAPALAAGCTVILKPSELTPLSALALAELGEAAGIPKGVFNVVVGKEAAAIGKVLTRSEVVRKISFTGSTRVGKLLMEQCADTIKSLSLELGGNAPFLVFDDADADAAVAGVIAAKFRNAGQTCVCANRIYAQAGIYNVFVEKLIVAVRALRVGNGLDNEVEIGPLINSAATRKVQRILTDATHKGAKVALGGKVKEGNFFEPTVLTEANRNMAVHYEEVFGPVVPVFKFNTEADAQKMANDTEYGLAAYFYTKDYARIWRLSEGLEYGMVGINTGLISTAVAPFGGIKSSGFGREGSKYGIESYLDIKYVCVAGLDN